MKIGKIEIEGTGLTNGHPAVIVTGKIKPGTVCAANGLLMLDETAGEYEPYDFSDKSRAACIALEPVTAETTGAVLLLHGTFNSGAVVKADGSSPTAAELAIAQKHSHIYFV
jgi:hypothetical protein